MRWSKLNQRDARAMATATGRIHAEIRMPHIGAEKATALNGCLSIRQRKPMQPPIEWAIMNHGSGRASARAKAITAAISN